jgi:hypothetical protein
LERNHSFEFKIISKYRMINHYFQKLKSCLENLSNESIWHKESEEIKHYMNNSKGTLSVILSIIIWFTYVDELFVLFNKRKRTIHDFLGNSYLSDLRSKEIVTNHIEG